MRPCGLMILLLLLSCNERESLKGYLQLDLYKVFKSCDQSSINKHIVTVVEGEVLASLWSKVSEVSVSSEEESLSVYIDHKKSNSSLIYYFYKNKFGKEKHYEFFDHKYTNSGSSLLFNFFFYLKRFKDHRNLVMKFLDDSNNELRTFQIKMEKNNRPKESFGSVDFLYRLNRNLLLLKKSSRMDGDLEYRTGVVHRMEPISFEVSGTYSFPITKEINYLAVLSFDNATKTELKVVLIDKLEGCRLFPRWTRAL